MSQLEYHALAGAARPSVNPRLHSLNKPYSRPSSYAGPSSNGSAHPAGPNGVAENGQDDFARVSPTKQAPSTRPGMVKSNSSGSLARSLARSGSDGSLFSTVKSIFSRPLQWLATPSKSSTPSKRPATAATASDRFDHDLEDPDFDAASASPSKPPQAARTTRASQRGDYDPPPAVIGRAVSGFMLPPLPAHVSLTPKSHARQQASPAPHGGHLQKSQTVQNFSRPLAASKSMPYLDPPTAALSPARNTRSKGLLTRSKRLDLASLAGDDDLELPDAQEMEHEAEVGEKRYRRTEEPDHWSPWKVRRTEPEPPKRGSASARRTPSRTVERDYALPSASPFRAPPSPLSPRQPTMLTRQTASSARQPSAGLTRSATVSNIRRHPSISMASDASMTRHTPPRPLRPSSSMLFGTNGDLDRYRTDERMSVDGDREGGRDNSALDWFMRDRWGSASPASASVRRHASLAPSTSMPKIRKGPLVWDGEQGFVREAELRADSQPPVHQNEAERILFALESLRKTPLSDARKPWSEGPLPSDLVGASSRSIRKAVQVPLATAQAGASAKQRRDRDRLGDERLSVLISPYGRRLQADQSLRDARRSEEVHMDDGYRPASSYSASPEPERRSPASSRRSPSADQTMSPEPAPAPSPRRSSRLRRDHSADKEETPKKRGGRSIKKAVVDEVEATPKAATKRGKRKTTADKGISTSPPPAVPEVPTITETAPSPADKATASSSEYRVRDDGESRAGSSLRAKTAVTKRTHQGSASYQSSREPSPSGGTTGRYSAREEDLPLMDELEQNKIPLPSFSGISFNLGAATPPAEHSSTPKSAPQPVQEQSASPSGGSLLSRLGPPAAKPPAKGSRLLGAAMSTRPRSSSPLAANSITAQPDSPPSVAPEKAAPAADKAAPPKADDTGFFSLINGPKPSLAVPKAPAPKPAEASTFFAPPAKTASPGLGLGKPPATDSSITPNGSVPDFFGKKSAPPSGTATPTFIFGAPKPAETAAPSAPAAPTFDFGLPKSDAAGSTTPKGAPPAGGFSFGLPKPAEGTTAALSSPSLGLKPAEPASTPSRTPSPFSFGSGTNTEPAKTDTAPAGTLFGKPVVSAKEAPKPAAGSFNFGTTPAPAASEPAKPAFSFGTPSSSTPASDKPAETPKFSFGSTSTPAPAPASTPAAGGFTFGSNTTATVEKKDEAPKPSGFSFGSSSASTPSAPASSSLGFSFGTTPAASAAEPSKAATGGFSFNKPAETTTNGSSSPSPFGFGKPAEAPAPTPGGFSFTKPAEPAKSAAPASSTSFSFGSTSTPATGGSGAFGAPANSAASNAPPFGAGAATSSFGTGFGAPSSGTTAFGQSASAATPAAPSNPFGSAAAASKSPAAPSTNAFGSTSTPSFTFGSAQPASNGGFGSPSTQPTAAFGQATPAFGVNGTSTTPAAAAQPASNPFGSSASGGFGSSNPTSTTAGFSFGSTPASQPASSSFGGFGNTAQPAQPSFTFGAASSTPTSTPGQAGAAGSTPFAFGASTTTPTSQPFVFGAGASQPTTPGGGAAPRFGSPGVDAGFSMGQAGDVPGSPSGRKIKPLRRTGTKR